MHVFHVIDSVARFAAGFCEGTRHPFTSAVILAGGMGTRMQKSMGKGEGGTTKQFLSLCGEPVILHTLRAFDASSFIDEIILVVRKEETEKYPEMLKNAGISKVKRIVSGGETRQDSAFEGLLAIADESKYIAIHDGARPLILPAQIERVAREAYHTGAAAAANRAKDTVKLCDGAGYVKETPNRETVWCVSTPQIFKAEEYRAACYMGRQKKLAVTDDCMLVEDIGFPVRLVDVGYENIKITTKEDLYFANAILAMRADAKEASDAGI